MLITLTIELLEIANVVSVMQLTVIFTHIEHLGMQVGRD